MVVGKSYFLRIVHDEAAVNKRKLNGLRLMKVVESPFLRNAIEMKLQTGSNSTVADCVAPTRALLVERATEFAFAQACPFWRLDMREILFPNLSEEQAPRKVILSKMGMAQADFVEHAGVEVNLSHSHGQVDLTVGRSLAEADDEFVDPLFNKNGFGFVGPSTGVSAKEIRVTSQK